MQGNIAIVTGANRGIGLEVCRQLAERNYTVILGSRDLAKGEHVAARLNTKRVIPRQLDVRDPDSIDHLREWTVALLLINKRFISLSCRFEDHHRNGGNR